jgi:hypothetical protein
MSTNTITSPGALTPFALVAKAVGLEEWALQKVEPDDFRVGLNCRMIDGKLHLAPVHYQPIASDDVASAVTHAATGVPQNRDRRPGESAHGPVHPGRARKVRRRA